MRPRTIKRPHLKSRSGCVQCKSRKVKCDESPGACGACLKRNIRCSLRPPTPPHQRDDANGDANANANASPKASLPSSGFLDLELLHNFTTRTCLSVSRHVPLQRFYATVFVEEALKADWLLHCVLGLSAFHLAQQHQVLAESAGESCDSAVRSRARAREYLVAAHAHHNIGLGSFRQNLDCITPDSCHALFGCACIIIMSAFAQSCRAIGSIADDADPDADADVDGNTDAAGFDAAQSSGPTMVRWLLLVRGITTILAEADQWITEGPMAPIIFTDANDGYDEDRGHVDHATSSYLDRLSATIAERSDPKIAETCLPAIALLRRSFAGISCGCDFSVVFVWPAIVQPDFIHMLEANRPEALVVLASFCVLLHTQDWRWWIEGWSSNMLKAIETAIDDDWRPWLSWPLQVVGSKDAGKDKEDILFVTEGICCQ